MTTTRRGRPPNPGRYGFARGVQAGLPSPLMRYTWKIRTQLHRVLRYSDILEAVKRTNGRRGGRPVNKPSYEDIVIQFGDRWLSRWSEGPGAARAWLVKQLAAEYGTDERTARRWVEEVYGDDLKGRRKKRRRNIRI